MIPAKFLEFIENNFQEEEKQVLIPCLLQDSRVHAALSNLAQNEEKDINRLKVLDNWKPVYFAFLLQDQKNWNRDLPAIIKTIHSKNSEENSSVKEVLSEKEESISLVEAAEKAIELFNLIQKIGWKEIEKNISENFYFTPNVGLIAACLLGLVNEEEFVEQEISHSKNCEIKKMFCYGLLCNPITEDTLEKYIAKLIGNLEQEEKIEMLQFIGKEGRIQLSRSLIQSELQSLEKTVSTDPKEGLQIELDALQKLNILSDVHFLEGKTLESQNEIEQFIQKLDQLKLDAQKKKKSLTSSGEEKKNVVSQDESFHYSWKNAPEIERTFHWKKPTDQAVEEFLKEVETEMAYHSSDSKFFLQLSELFHALEDYQHSIEYLKIAKILDTTNAEIDEKLVNSCIESRQWNAALHLIRTGNKKEKESDLTTFYLESKQLLANGDKEAVRQRLEGLPKGFTSTDAEDLFEIGDLFMELGEWEQAQNYFMSSIDAGTMNYQAWINSYICLFKLNQKEKAAVTADQAIGTFYERRGFYERMILAFLECGEEDKGLALIEKINIENGDPGAIAAIIQYLENKKQFEYAYDLALRSIHHFPLHADLGIRTAQVFMENGEYEKAVRRLDLIRDAKENDKEFILFHSLSALKSSVSTFPLGSHKIDDSALVNILERIKKLPEGDYWRGLIEAQVLSLQDFHNKAVERFKGLILENSLSQNRSELWRAQVGLAQTLMNINQAETAITLLNEALKAQPESLALYELLADAYRNKNLGEEAETTIKTAQRLCSGEKKFTAWYVEQMLKLGKPDEIRSYFSKEAALHQSSPEFLVERLVFENRYGSQEATKAIIKDLILLEKASAKDLHAALEIAQASKFNDLSLKIVQKLQKTDQNDAESCMVKACVYWNQRDHQTAIKSLEPLGEVSPWNMIRNALKVLDKPMEHDLSDIQSVLANRDVINKQFNELPEYINGILPEEWTAVFSTNDQWIKLILLKTFENSDAVNTKSVDLPFDLQTEQVSTSAFQSICKWLKDGKEDSIDWVGLLSELNKIENTSKKKSLTGIILNILLENGNEIAAASIINPLSDESLNERNMLFAKARLLQRNRNTVDAQEIYQQALTMSTEKKQSDDLDERILSVLVNLPKWQADCAFEMGDWQKAAAASIQSLNVPVYYSDLKENGIDRFFNLALKEWTYRKIGVSKNLPDILGREEFINLPEYALSLPTELQSQYRYLHTFLMHGQSSSFDQSAVGFLSTVCQMISDSQQGNYEKVIQILEQNKRNKDLPLIALGLFPENKYGELIPAFHNVLFEYKKDAYLSAGMAKIFTVGKETELAIDAYETALSVLNDESVWRTQLAKLYEEKGELQKAILHSEQAVTLDPGNQDNKKEYIGDLYAVQNYRKVVDLFEENQQQFTDDDEIIRKVINAYFQIGEYRKALSYIQMQRGKMKDDLEMLLIQARIAEKLGSIPKAMEIIRNAYRIDPKSPEVIIELARIKSLQENDAFGLEIIEKALESNISSKQLILEKAAYLEHVRGKKKAIDFLEGYLEKANNPDFQLLNRYADLLDQDGKQDEALNVYEKSIQINESQAEIHKMIGILSMKKGNLDKAVFHFDKAIFYEPHDMQVYLDMADVLLARRESQRAAKVMQMALENCKEHYLIYEKASKVYNQLGDAEKAESYLRKATALNPTDNDLREKLGILLAKRIFNKE